MKKAVLFLIFSLALPIIAAAMNLKATIAGKEVPLRSQMGFHFVGTTQAPPFEVTVTADTLLTSFDVSPHSKGVKAEIKGQKASFVIEKPGYYVGSFNEGHHFFLFVDEKDFSSTGIPLSSFVNPDNTGRTDVTDKIQEAINKASQKKKTLIIPEGKYLCRQLVLPNNCSLQLEKGAELLLNPVSYRMFRNEKFTRPAFIVSEGRNIRISGLGTINCNATELYTRHGRRGRIRAIFFRECQKVLLEGITVLDGGAWTTHFFGCRDVTVRNIKVISNLMVLGTDGIDPDGVNKMTVRDCFVCSGDDGVVVKSTNPDYDVNDVLVEGNVILSGASALKIGTETVAMLMNNVSFVNNDVILTRWGPHLLIRDGQNLNNILFENNRYENWYYGLNYSLVNKKVNPEGNPVDPRTFNPAYKKPMEQRRGNIVYIYSTKRKENVVPGNLTNIVLKDNTFEIRPLSDGSVIKGRDEAKVEVSIKNLVVGGKPVSSINEIPVKVKNATVKIE